jgi:hypothetical protein
MAWTSKPLFLAGRYPTDLELEAMADQIDALTGTGFTTYTPTWTASSVNPAIGNGTIDAGYRRSSESDLVQYEGRLLAGSTTTFGTGFWQISIPVAPAAASANRATLIGLTLDSSAGTSVPVIGRFFGGTVLVFNGTAGTSISATVPFTWATSDELRWSITYEAA